MIPAKLLLGLGMSLGLLTGALRLSTAADEKPAVKADEKAPAKADEKAPAKAEEKVPAVKADEKVPAKADEKVGEKPKSDVLEKAPDKPVKLDFPPLEAAEVAKIVAGSRDGGYVVDGPDVQTLIEKLRDTPHEHYFASHTEKATRWADLIERSDAFRGKWILIDGHMQDSRLWEGGDPKKPIYQALIKDLKTQGRFTVLLPMDIEPNVRVRMKGYYIRFRQYEDAGVHGVSPLVVGKGWIKVVDPGSVRGGRTGLKVPFPEEKYNTPDGRKPGPDLEELTHLEELLERVDDSDGIIDAEATLYALELCAKVSVQDFTFTGSERYLDFSKPTFMPNQYRGHLMPYQGIVRKIEEFPVVKRGSAAEKFYVITMNQPDSRYIYTVVTLDKPENLNTPYWAKFKGYFIKLRQFQTKAKESGTGPVLVTQRLFPADETSPAGEEDTSSAMGWQKVVVKIFTGWGAWIVLTPFAGALVYWYINKKRPEDVVMLAHHQNLAPAEPLTSRAVIDTLAAMSNGIPPPPEPGTVPSLERIPETKPLDENWPLRPNPGA